MGRSYASPATVAGTIGMQTILLVNDQVIPLNDFTQTFLGNVIKGIVVALGHEANEVVLSIDDSGLHIYTETGEIPLRKDFARLLIESTIKGMLSPLKGIFWLGKVSISCKRVEGEIFD